MQRWNAWMKEAGTWGVGVSEEKGGKSRNDLTRLTRADNNYPKISKLFFSYTRGYYRRPVFLLPPYNSFIPSFRFPKGASSQQNAISIKRWKDVSDDVSLPLFFFTVMATQQSNGVVENYFIIDAAKKNRYGVVPSSLFLFLRLVNIQPLC